MAGKAGTVAAPQAANGAIDHLGQFPIFSTLAPDTLAALAAHTQKRSFAANSLIFQRGDSGDYMLAITKGRVKVTLNSAQGRELMLRQLGPGDVLGEVALIDGQPRSADCMATEATTALVLRRDHFLAVARSKPEIGLAMAAYMSSLLRDTNFQMESIALHDLQSRLIRFFLYALRQTHGESLPDRPVLQLNLSQTDLSSILGSSRPKINQALQNLIAANAITRQGDRITCDVDRLRDLADISDSDGAF